MKKLGVYAVVLVFLAHGRTWATPPKQFAAVDIARKIKHFSKDIGFGYSGVAFYGGRLFASCNLGLLSIDENLVPTLMQWDQSDSVIEGPWVDQEGHELWAQRADDGSFLKFNGSAWEAIPLPKPPRSYFSRGDMLSGFRGISAPHGFWIEGGNCVWRWDRTRKSWAECDLPLMSQGSLIRAFFPLKGSNLFFVRRGFQRGTNDNLADIYSLPPNSRSHEVPDQNIREYVSCGEGCFIRTEDGGLFELNADGILPMKSLSFCEAITNTTGGRLLAVFRGKGVYCWGTSGWSRLAALPFNEDEGEHWSHLTEYDGEMALATSVVPHLVGTRFAYSGTSGVWVSKGGVFQLIPCTK